MQIYQTEKNLIFDVLQRKLYGNDGDGNLVDTGKGKWFIDFVAGVPTHDGCRALAASMRTHRDFKQWWTVRHTITGQESTDGVHVVTLIIDDEKRIIRRIDTGEALKAIIANERGWLDNQNFANASAE